MTDLTQAILPRLRQYRLPGLDLSPDYLYPNYAGYSILNIPQTVCRLLGVPPLEASAGPLADEILAPLEGEIRKLILVVVDSLALHRLQRWASDGTAPVWSRLIEAGELAALTSITPSTTSAALTTFWTGRSAAEHGITGYEMWMKEYGVVANTITHAPITFAGPAGSLKSAGFDPLAYLTFPTLGQHLAAHGVPAFAFQHQSILHSGLSSMFFKEVKGKAFFTASDLWVNLRQWLEQEQSRRSFAYVYWSEVDTLSHRFGPDDERVASDFSLFSLAFERLFLDRLAPQQCADTLVLLTADHGGVYTPLDPHYDLRNHPNFTRRLHILPTGEHRMAYLYIRPGQTEAVREYVDRTWPNQFVLFDPVYAVEAGLFGPGAPHPRLLDRLGDLVMAARGPASLWWADKENFLLGRHGGLMPEEMLVPLVAARL